MAIKIFKCSVCGNIAVKVVDSNVPMVCCGQKMELLTPNTVDASEEKHLPVMTDLGGGKIKVEVGSVAHPMLPEHHISFIIVETTDGFLYKPFIETTKGSPAEKAEALFNIGNDDKIVALYEYCNIHGLWKSDIKN